MLPVSKKIIPIQKVGGLSFEQNKLSCNAEKVRSNFAARYFQSIDFNGLLRVANIIPGRSVLPFHPLSINSGVCSRCLVALDRAGLTIDLFCISFTLRRPTLYSERLLPN